MTDLEKAEGLFKEYKVKEAYPLFRSLAEGGDARAMYFMALYHNYYLEAAPWDPEEAAKWALKGAQAGDPLCAFFCLLHSDGIAREELDKLYEKRETWISKVKENPDCYALEALGCYTMIHADEHTELDEAFSLLHTAAMGGYWKAWNDIGQFYDPHVQDNPEFVRHVADPKRSMEAYRKSAEAGYPDAFNRLAYFYYLGTGVTKDKKEGIRLFRKAFAKGHLRAGVALGVMYIFDGNGTSDKKEGFKITKKAAEGNDPLALGNLANCYFYGHGTKKDRRLAKIYYQKASDLGMDSSTTQLGVIYHEDGNDKKAFELFRKAADHHYVEALGWLAACYQFGYGTEKNTEKAMELLQHAAAHGSEDAKIALQQIRSEMSE